MNTNSKSGFFPRILETHTIPPAEDPSVVHWTVRLGPVVVGFALPSVRLARVYTRTVEQHNEILKAV